MAAKRAGGVMGGLDPVVTLPAQAGSAVRQHRDYRGEWRRQRMRTVAGPLARRLLYGGASLVGVVCGVFFLTHVLPGNPAQAEAGPFATKAALAAMERQLGLDQSIWSQFGHYIVGLAHGNLGVSAVTGHSVTADLLQRIPTSLEIVIPSVCLSLAAGVSIGMAGALRPRSIWSRLGQGLVVYGTSVPLFWIALMVIYIFFSLLGVAPAPSGQLSNGIAAPPSITGSVVINSVLSGDWPALWSALGHLVAPVLTLGSLLSGGTVKLVRSVSMEVLASDYVRTARALRIGGWTFVRMYLLRNVAAPLATLIGIQLGYLLGGCVIIEEVFNWPGVGAYAWQALNENDFFAIQGFIVFVGTAYILLNIVVDIFVMFVDPRVKA